MLDVFNPEPFHPPSSLVAALWLNSSSPLSRPLPHPLQNHIRNMRLAADARAVPNQLPMFLGRIAPGWLPALQPFLHHPPRFAQHFRYVLERVQPVADEKR